MIPKQLHEGLLFVVYQVRARSEALKDHAGLRMARAQQAQLLARTGHATMSELSPLSAAKRTIVLGASISHFDPERSSALSKYSSYDRPRRLPNVEFGQLHCRTLILGTGHATA